MRALLNFLVVLLTTVVSVALASALWFFPNRGGEMSDGSKLVDFLGWLYVVFPVSTLIGLIAGVLLAKRIRSRP